VTGGNLRGCRGFVEFSGLKSHVIWTIRHSQLREVGQGHSSLSLAAASSVVIKRARTILQHFCTEKTVH